MVREQSSVGPNKLTRRVVKALNIAIGARSNEFIRKALTNEVSNRRRPICICGRLVLTSHQIRSGRIKRIGSDQEPRTMSDITRFVVVDRFTDL